VECDQLKADSINFESHWTPWQGGDHLVLQKGSEFDTIVLGIPVERLKVICAELIAHSPRWQAMATNIKTIQTPIVTWDLGGNVPHIDIVVGTKSPQSDRYMIVHNIGRGLKMEDVLFDWKITGHYSHGGPNP
jgi:uncharacterized protein with NAD-binding domain and iron-sulfur cluster